MKDNIRDEVATTKNKVYPMSPQILLRSKLHEDANQTSDIGKLVSLSKKENSIFQLDQVDRLFRHSSITEFSIRRDVVSKGILRAFRKFIVSTLKVNKRKTRRRDKSLAGIKTLVIEKAESVGLVDYSNQELCSPVYVNLV